MNGKELDEMVNRVVRDYTRKYNNGEELMDQKQYNRIMATIVIGILLSIILVVVVVLSVLLTPHPYPVILVTPTPQHVGGFVHCPAWIKTAQELTTCRG